MSDYRVVKSDAGAADGRTADAGNRIRYSDGVCDLCMRKHCGPEIGACESDPTCASYASCTGTCDPANGGCFYDCLSRLDDRINLRANGLAACSFGECPAECVPCGRPFSGLTPTCATCVTDDLGPGGLCELASQCLLDPDCGGYLQCLSERCKRPGASDPACRLSCGAAHASGARTFTLGFGLRLVGSSCRDKCSVGKSWDCLPTEWPPVSGGRATVTLYYPAAVPDASVPAVRVRACRMADPLCRYPVGEGETDRSGQIAFEVDQISVAEGIYYYEIYGSGGVVPSVIFVPQQPTVTSLALQIPGTQGTLDQLRASVEQRGDTLDPNAPILGVQVADCLGAPADFASSSPEVTITSYPGGQAYYGLDPTAPGGGIATFIHLQPGTVTLSVNRNGSLIATAALVPVRAGAFTFVTFNYPSFYQ